MPPSMSCAGRRHRIRTVILVPVPDPRALTVNTACSGHKLTDRASQRLPAHVRGSPDRVKAVLRHRLVVVIGRTSCRQAHPTGHRRKYARRIHSGGYGRGFPSASTQAGSRLCHCRAPLYIRPWDQLRLSQGYPIRVTGSDSWSSTAPPSSRTARVLDVTLSIDSCTVGEQTSGKPPCSRLLP